MTGPACDYKTAGVYMYTMHVPGPASDHTYPWVHLATDHMTVRRFDESSQYVFHATEQISELAYGRLSHPAVPHSIALHNIFLLSGTTTGMIDGRR
jgi:hypothetical protein